MSVITLFSGAYCDGEDVARNVAQSLGYKLIDDQTIIEETGKRFSIDETKLVKALAGKTSIFNKFTHERERSLACLKIAVADYLSKDNQLFLGFAGLMIPREISHVLRVCLIADIKFRTSLASKLENLSEKEAQKRVLKEDEKRVLWAEYLYNQRDPWTPDLYDIVIPRDKTSLDDAAALICRNIGKDVLRVTAESKKQVADFALASQVDLGLAGAGHNVAVASKDGHITVVINKHVLRLAALEAELKKIVSVVPGVRSVETKVGPGYYQTDIYRKYDFELPLPSKVLLVDDEREFVQTLSERLQMRDLGSAVVYNGEEALSVVDEDEPEVMVLDLKMPGIDGVEVLRRVKKEHPNVEVIVLTGHGSTEIEKQCMELGACAYLEKPVDIDTLTKMMQEAYRKLREKKNR